MPLDLNTYKDIRVEAILAFPHLTEDLIDDILQTSLSADFTKTEAFNALNLVKEPKIAQILFYSACSASNQLNDIAFQRVMTALGMPIDLKESQRIITKLGFETLNLTVFEIFIDEVSKL